MCKILLSLIFILNCGCLSAERKTNFEKLSSQNWELKLDDKCSSTDWKEKWFLDGEKAKVSNSSEAMTIDTAQGYAVLWTKKEFTGDVKIEYDFKRDDDFFGQAVNIIYIQATGDGEKGYDKDITKWSDKRKTAAMSDYFQNMHTYHISYAAYNKKGKNSEYIRARRYLPLGNKRLKGTQLAGEYTVTGLFEDKKWVHVTIIKRDKDIFIEFKHPDKTLLCHFKNEDKGAIKEGRIGLRLMPKRLSHFKNFKVSELK